MNDFDKFQNELDAMSVEDLYAISKTLWKKLNDAYNYKNECMRYENRKYPITETRIMYYHRKLTMLNDKIIERLNSIGIQII